MPGRVLVGSELGCFVVDRSGAGAMECEQRGRSVGPFLPQPDGTCLAIVDGIRVERRSLSGTWHLLAVLPEPVQSLVADEGGLVVGGREEASLWRVERDGTVRRLDGFAQVTGRETWFAGGPPLGVRSLAAPLGGTALLAGVHVGGIPRSADGGRSWTPTIPVLYDVHELSVHPKQPAFVAAAAAVGLCLSTDGGQSWRLRNEGLAGSTCLAVCVEGDEVLFSVQDSPFATRSEVWSWSAATDLLGQLREGLPNWLEGRVDTGGIACGAPGCAIVDGGGTLWFRAAGLRTWTSLEAGLPYALGVAVL